ncbi:serine hydrolase [Bradyrhizobium sp. AUGA SZCCT0158]|nr:serine hydrolase [Bradyrhizobium sp. AUGA SZCCT0158]MBR1196000.1 serine hydrolase [Bradyrhizobium sp. AUGA SZCCT0158]
MRSKTFAIAIAVATGSVLSTASFAAELTTENDPESVGFASERLERIGAWYQARVDATDLLSKDTGDLSGAVVGIAKGGKLAYLKAVGFQDRTKSVPMKSDSIFWIASMTKPVTSAAVLILVDEGKLELDAPVTTYLPELANMQVGIATSDAATGKTSVALEAQHHPMTVRDLLRHTSGLVYPPQFLGSPINQLYANAVFARDKTLDDFVKSLRNLPLAHQPGKVWGEYSWSTDVLARVIEVISGQPFDAFLENRIFKPLRMLDTGFYVPPDKIDRLVDAPEPRNPQFDVTRPRKLLSGGGGLVSTAADYLRFSQMLLNGGELEGTRILKAETVRSMTTNSLPSDVRFAMNFVGPSVGSTWGLGLAVRTNPDFSNVPGSSGSYSWNGLWGNFFWADPAEHLAAVLMIQVVPSKANLYRAALRNLTYGALRVPEPAGFAPPARPIALGAAALDDYVGKYDFGQSSSARDKMNSSSSAPGIGAEIELTGGGVRIRRALDNSPSANAGLKSGDVITEIDGAPVTGLTVNQVIARLRGPVNVQVKLKLTRA